MYITDFNVAKKKNIDGSFHMMTKTGTLAFSAPEIFSDTYYSEKVDVWAAGVVFYAMICGELPFQTESLP